ncbi:hypothetical protein ONS95_005565 [Cadophora gregata]|uniref:uncharacterized protein n=1 Tax=Cadophora gregata TaxID=51156 RepID=UPI0026DD7665|nr:uncharacterized protein ONS95_005565 [Cadophora gregata]KAK0103546.1 hypothetical protein ONS95_005565 [Cadophora gregata]KAK0107739.1 hypothetical protein ONS96_003537 [Cadophora gregata f. sp. sojae]
MYLAWVESPPQLLAPPKHISHNLSGFTSMSWSANIARARARAMDPQPAIVNIPLTHAQPVPIETSPAQLAGPGVSPSSDDAFVPDNPGSEGIRQSSIASTSTSSGSRPNQAQPQSQSQSQSQAQQAKDKERATVPSACVQCRSKHLKCDGLQPCSRCSSNGFECEYVRSRRGFKGPRRNGIQNKASSISGAPVDMSCPLVHPNGVRGTPNVPSGLATPPDHRLMTLPRPVDLPLFDIGQDVVAFDPKALPSGLDLRERCIEAFYYHFYPAHPFNLPRNNHFALRKERPIDYLEAAMRYVGSFYVPQAPTVALGLEAERSVYQADCPKDGFRVQAMLILAIGLDGYTYQEKALQILLDAQDLALELGMHNREFAFMNGVGSEVLQESWRRTWWELYITDGMIAGVHQKSNFRMKDILADVLLPCEEREYITGVSVTIISSAWVVKLIAVAYSTSTFDSRF